MFGKKRELRLQLAESLSAAVPCDFVLSLEKHLRDASTPVYLLSCLSRKDIWSEATLACPGRQDGAGAILMALTIGQVIEQNLRFLDMCDRSSTLC